MPLLPLVGHSEAMTRILEALDAGRFPQTVLLAGPQGTGKQRFALWIAQALVCGGRKQGTGTREQELPCGDCGPCRRVLGLAHPDVHWYVPVPRPKAGEADKQVEETEELLGDLMAERREQPLWTTPDGMAIHSVASARLLLRQASMKSVEGGPKVFVIGDAERLVPQESSQEAANALLKLLEEPPPSTYFVLTTADPRRVLPTIRSRSIILRLGRLSDAEVREFLRSHLQPAPAGSALEARVAAAEGSIGQALAETGQRRKARDSAAALLEAVAKGGSQPWERALRQNPWQARGEFTEMLDALAELLSDQARSAIAAAGRQGGRAADPALVVRAIEKVQAARDAAQGNVNPQLLLATLADDLAGTL